MLIDSFQSIAVAAQKLVKNWRAVIVLVTLYAMLLVTLYLFVTVREATARQVGVTLLLAVAAPVLFFLIQTAAACWMRNCELIALVKEALRSFWKVVVVTVPLVALAMLVLYLLIKIQGYVAPRDVSDLISQYQIGVENNVPRTVPWSITVITAVRYVFIALVLPILAIHFWIAATNEGLLSVIRRLKQIFLRALGPNSVLIYITGFIVFGLIPYLLLFKPIPASRPWLEMGLFVGRLAIVFALTLFGWVLTMAALAASDQRRDTTTEVL